MKRAVSLVVLLALAATACQEREPEPASSTSQLRAGSAQPPSAAAQSAKPTRAAPSGRVSKTLGSAKPSPEDPLDGKFTLEQATAGLPRKGELQALLHTSKGTLRCELYPDKAPNTVANFVGLARGLRPWKQGDEWVKKPLYDGTKLYSVVKGFAFEGGSPGDKFNEDIGYFIADEIWEGARHDQRGLLCMRAFTPDRSGSQFMILDAATPQLDHSFTIFGKCGPSSVLDAIGNSPVDQGRPKAPIELRRVEIVRR